MPTVCVALSGELSISLAGVMVKGDIGLYKQFKFLQKILKCSRYGPLTVQENGTKAGKNSIGLQFSTNNIFFKIQNISL